jgi:hypothetical protein
MSATFPQHPPSQQKLHFIYHALDAVRGLMDGSAVEKYELIITTIEGW